MEQSNININYESFHNEVPYDSQKIKFKSEEYSSNSILNPSHDYYNYNNHPIVNDNIDTTKTYEQQPMFSCINDQHSSNQYPLITSSFTPQDEPSLDQNYYDINEPREFNQISYQDDQFQSPNILDINNPIEFYPTNQTASFRFEIPGFEIIIIPTSSDVINNTQIHNQYYYGQNNICDISQFYQHNSFDSEMFSNLNRDVISRNYVDRLGGSHEGY
ncbi:hypothetical protein RhiirA5_498291 [Rhizophagus irregularis]|uniref:Uncharacterized protein n=3 Tax=Rhizophagus irregularis TaxID=588596 RepID=U9UXN5_RHIID|nr:hypothetical protein GLOIN_2v1548249 [Rhizophagus irregularis DAOM 181602=DAOM 197198]EXX69079.1 hypothetical protein RirG_099170 [Rhizophagus irregularis DAOM 197198w]PKC10654.1 hypothetical protein RhiirA5_498291 [Rhizophagus irregularis]PKC68924.1 hypothetical protein RhiirA1_440324 [Rhizophagus irregularis]PKY21893.1 hypothetical protein RhiirB3_501596 [Rhizophagus irregularis]POG77354.1 hypothetical protein GLOIN_2v1548249 [Rhizophagus irregularis DAOM 181602=DAOM 197198]|eukprot:XP_025184220.1 hypothetical protein GLOIN_2v1548249 [Rhizophagus irregularis DAOM 181602=DAOM 197198]